MTFVDIFTTMISFNIFQKWMHSIRKLIFNNHEVFYKINIFVVLFELIYVVRIWKFSLIDEIIFYNKNFVWNINFVDRLKKIKQIMFDKNLKFLFFNIKNKIVRETKDQIYNITTRQKCKIIFYINIYAIDIFFVKLIFNMN